MVDTLTNGPQITPLNVQRKKKKLIWVSKDKRLSTDFSF